MDLMSLLHLGTFYHTWGYKSWVKGDSLDVHDSLASLIAAKVSSGNCTFQSVSWICGIAIGLSPHHSSWCAKQCHDFVFICLGACWIFHFLKVKTTAWYWVF